MTPEFKAVLAGLCVLWGAFWFVRTWVKMRADQRAAESPYEGYWGRVFARERVNRARGELCAALLVVMVGVMLGVHAIG